MVQVILPGDRFGKGELSDTDEQVLEMISRGATEEVVASELSITPIEVHEHMRHLVKTMSGLTSQWHEAVRLAVAAEPIVPMSPALAAATSRGLARLFAATQGDEDRFVALLDEVTRAAEQRRERPDAMTQAQADFLVESGSMTAEELVENEAEVARGDLAAIERQTELEPVIESVGSARAGALLGIEESSVRHRKDKGLLYSFKTDRSLRYPTWQFIESDDPKRRTLPNLSAVVKAIPDTMHPASVLGFMTTPQADLMVEDEAVTPVEWLKGGGDVQEVVDLLRERDRS